MTRLNQDPAIRFDPELYMRLRAYAYKVKLTLQDAAARLLKAGLDVPPPDKWDGRVAQIDALLVQLRRGAIPTAPPSVPTAPVTPKAPPRVRID